MSGHITVTICDTGTGVKPEILPRILNRSVTDGGTGLGLSICKSAIEAMGGEHNIESEYGRGAAVFFTLPLVGEVHNNG